MPEWLLLTVLAAAPIQTADDRFDTREQCLAAGRQWYERILTEPENKARCDTVIGGDRCKFTCITAAGS